MSQPYTVEYFIAKFEAIPETSWCVGSYSDGMGRHCARGHCGDRSHITTPPMANALRELLPDVVLINDGQDPLYQQPTPKQRILAALRSLK